MHKIEISDLLEREILSQTLRPNIYRPISTDRHPSGQLSKILNQTYFICKIPRWTHMTMEAVKNISLLPKWMQNHSSSVHMVNY